MRARSRTTLLAAGITALALSACGEAETAASRVTAAPSAEANRLPTGGSGEVVVASASFPENQILASVYEQALDAAGYTATVKALTTRPVIVPQVASGAVDVEPDYVGALTEYLNKEKNGPDAPQLATGDLAETLAKTRELAEPAGLTVLEPSPAADQNAFAVTEAYAEKHGLTKISDLSKVQEPIVLGGAPECQTYALCQPGLERVYGLDLQFQQTDIGGPLTVAALKRGTVQVNQFLSSDGSAKLNGFVVLEDDKKLAPVDNVVPVISKDYADDALFKDVLNRVSASMTTDDLLNLNASLSIDRKLPEKAAEDFLKAKGLIA